MDWILQVWGGGFYLTNKVLFALAEGRSEEKKRRLKLVGWTVYLLGVPAWVAVFVSDHNWIAAAVEGGAIPAMLLGVFYVYRRQTIPDLAKERIVSAITGVALVVGIGFSLVHHRGLTSLNQVLEIPVMVGFLLGSFYLAQSRLAGWIFFMIMNVSTAALMALQENWILAGQQVISLGFVVYGFTATLRHRRPLVAGGLAGG